MDKLDSKTIKILLECYNKAHDYGLEDPDLLETLSENKIVYKQSLGDL